jgi:hypothetical protein
MVEIFGWSGIIFTVVGLFVSSHTLAFYLGHKRGGGQFRLSNPFGPAPIEPRVDPLIMQEYRILKAGNDNLSIQLTTLEMDYKRLKNAYEVLDAKSTVATKRAARRALDKELTLGK